MDGLVSRNSTRNLSWLQGWSIYALYHPSPEVLAMVILLDSGRLHFPQFLPHPRNTPSHQFHLSLPVLSLSPSSPQLMLIVFLCWRLGIGFGVITGLCAKFSISCGLVCVFLLCFCFLLGFSESMLAKYHHFNVLLEW